VWDLRGQWAKPSQAQPSPAQLPSPAISKCEREQACYTHCGYGHGRSYPCGMWSLPCICELAWEVNGSISVWLHCVAGCCGSESWVVRQRSVSGMVDFLQPFPQALCLISTPFPLYSITLYDWLTHIPLNWMHVPLGAQAIRSWHQPPKANTTTLPCLCVHPVTVPVSLTFFHGRRISVTQLLTHIVTVHCLSTVCAQPNVIQFPVVESSLCAPSFSLSCSSLASCCFVIACYPCQPVYHSSGQWTNTTHFEFDLNDKIGGSEREMTPEPSLCNAARSAEKREK
jgi:hypothetical protein